MRAGLGCARGAGGRNRLLLMNVLTGVVVYSYRSNVQEVSAILHQQLVAPQQELLFWVELVMSTAGAPHLRSPAVHLTVMERFHLDVIALLVMLYWFLTKVVKLVKVYWDDWGATEREQYYDDKKNE